MRLSDIVRGGPSRPGAPRRVATPSPGGERDDRRREDLDAAALLYEQAVERVREAFTVAAGAPFSLTHADEAVDVLLKSLESSDALLASFFASEDGIAGLERKAVKVAIVSLKVGLELKYSRKQLHELGLAALLCDVGTTLVSADLLGKQGPFTPEERALLQERHGDGARLLQTLMPGHRWLAEVVRRRYEKANAPRPLEDALDEYAAIIHLADIYKSLVSPRPPRTPLGPLDALKEILARHRSLFPDRIVKPLIRALSAFPVGSLVRLNSGEIGRVVSRDKDFPLRPVVEILVRRERRVEPVVIDLRQRPLLYITESVVDEALP